MLALKAEFARQGLIVLENEAGKEVGAYLLHGEWFDQRAFRKQRKSPTAPVLHRIDGPISLYRADGSGRDQDKRCFSLNAKFASITVFQSRWSLEQNLSLGYMPVNPVIICNASDPEIFHEPGRIPFSRDRKIRLISTSWSSNPGKGFAMYRHTEDRLDWNRFEYTFVGNSPIRFSRIRHVPPVPSRSLAELLRSHDLFITASRNDPCSNSLIEALSCGLPALYVNDGGHPELVKEGGLSFQSEDDVLMQLDRLVDRYEQYQKCVIAPRMEDVACRYMQVAGVGPPPQ